MASQKKEVKSKAVPFDTLEQLNLNAAGIDIGDREIWVAVPQERDEQPIRRFFTFTHNLQALTHWLIACKIDTVAMESTGIYWIPLYDLLEQAGLKVCLINARHLKSVPGRKSDVLDCQWLQQLHTYGLLQASFRPDANIRQIRTLSRQRTTLLQYRARHIQHLQKTLQLMNLKLTSVVGSVTSKTGLTIIRAILKGERDPHRLAKLRDPRCKHSEHTIAQALHGTYLPEHLFLLKQALFFFETFSQQIHELDLQLNLAFNQFDPQVDLDQQPLPKARRPAREKNSPAFDLRKTLYLTTGVDLTQVDGIGELTAQTFISEVGLDMSPWPTVKHFASWLALAPYQDVSAGKVLKSGTRPSNNRANTALRLAAKSLLHSRSPLGVYYRALRARLGPQKAITAAAHKLARILYHMLKYKQPFNPDLLLQQSRQKQKRQLGRLQRQAQALGYQLSPADTALLPQPT